MKKITRTITSTNVAYRTENGDFTITLSGEHANTKTIRKELSKLVEEEFMIMDFDVEENLYEASVEDFMRIARKVDNNE